jgi:riboflavin synthase alpha subunit
MRLNKSKTSVRKRGPCEVWAGEREARQEEGGQSDEYDCNLRNVVGVSAVFGEHLVVGEVCEEGEVVALGRRRVEQLGALTKYRQVSYRIYKIYRGHINAPVLMF